MSGIAGLLLTPGRSVLCPEDLGSMGGGLAPGGPIRSLGAGRGRLGLSVSGSAGYGTWLVSRVIGDADAALALHGQITNAPAFDPGVPVKLGLPIIRTSVDHGTAFDIAWTGQAFTDSLTHALAYARRLISGS